MQQTQPMQPYDVRSSDQLAKLAQPSSGRELPTHDTHDLNVHGNERIASLLLGGLALAYAASRRPAASALLAAVGSALVYRGATGHCHMYQALGVSTRSA